MDDTTHTAVPSGGMEPFPLVGERVRLETTTPIYGGTYPRNIVLFGETGVGKSSIINLIAGKELAPTSNDALGCTNQPQRHDVTLALPQFESESQSVTVSLWDTAGLDEGTQGAVPATTSITHLQSLLRALALSSAGVHLLVFCIRGTMQLNQASRRHYDIVYAGLCCKKVRIALVVTGLEHQYLESPAGMETWWEENKGRVRQLGMQFDKHVCVTAVGMEDGEGTGQERRLQSQKMLQELVVDSVRPDKTPWKTQLTWQQTMLTMLRDRLRGREASCADREGESNLSVSYLFYATLRRWLAALVTSRDRMPAKGQGSRPSLDRCDPPGV